MPRHIIALILTAVHLVIVMGPLAPLALHSPVVAHALTGECAGDCRICGCSPERSASHTCCCWQKKLRQETRDDHEEAGHGSCCQKKENHAAVVTISECPCGSGKLIAFSGAERCDLLPYHFIAAITTHHDTTFVQYPADRLTDRHGEPPDPPPKQV